MDYIGQSWLSNNASLPIFDVMPASITFLHTCLFLWSSIARWADSAPLRRADACPGYKASNVQTTDNGITADLTLAGSACNIYGQDLSDLKLLVEYQTGTYRLCICVLCSLRRSHASRLALSKQGYEACRRSPACRYIGLDDLAPINGCLISWQRIAAGHG